MKKATKEMIAACIDSGKVEKPAKWGILVSGGWNRPTKWEVTAASDIVHDAHRFGDYEVYATREDFDNALEEFPIPATFPVVEISYDNVNGDFETLPLSKAPSEFEWAMRVHNNDAPAKWCRWFNTLADAQAAFPWIDAADLSDTDHRLLETAL